MTIQNESAYSKIIESAKVAGFRELVAFLLGHPLERVKTLRQAEPTLSSFTIAKITIVQGRGFEKISAFYSGGVANGSRQLFKAMYRAPLRGYVIENVRQNFPNASVLNRSLMSSLLVATADTILSCPLQRWMVWRITSEQKRSSYGFFANREPGSLPLHKDIFKGFTVSYLRQLSSWCSYLVFSECWREIAKKSAKNPDELSVKTQVALGASSAMFNGFCTLPFDRVKTLVQQNSNKAPATFKNMGKIFLDVFKKEGITCCWKGFWVRLPHYILVGALTEGVNEKVDAIWKRSYKPA